MPRCRARTPDGTLCKNRVSEAGKRCYLHPGMSEAGPRAPQRRQSRSSRGAESAQGRPMVAGGTPSPVVLASVTGLKMRQLTAPPTGQCDDARHRLSPDSRGFACSSARSSSKRSRASGACGASSSTSRRSPPAIPTVPRQLYVSPKRPMSCLLREVSLGWGRRAISARGGRMTGWVSEPRRTARGHSDPRHRPRARRHGPAWWAGQISSCAMRPGGGYEDDGPATLKDFGAMSALPPRAGQPSTDATGGTRPGPYGKRG
jgi:hypothetical protein